MLRSHFIITTDRNQASVPTQYSCAEARRFAEDIATGRDDIADLRAEYGLTGRVVAVEVRDGFGAVIFRFAA